MSSIWGNKIKLSIFGESHGELIGIVLEGIKPGTVINLDNMETQLKRRKPGKSNLTTSRKESDTPLVRTGVIDNVATGAPILIEIQNKDQKSRDYEKLKFVPRPGHSDYSAYIKYEGFNDIRGGGTFSGRMTAPLVAAGSIARDIIQSQGIKVYCHITKLHNIEESGYLQDSNISQNQFDNLEKMELPFFDSKLESQGKKAIEEVKLKGDSLGGHIECIIKGLKPGIGDPFFDSLESNISKMIFSIPGIKAIEFGLGFDFGKQTGLEVSDTIAYANEKITFPQNFNGGILGGISNGADIVFKVAIKPTPSISALQKTIDLEKKQNVQMEIEGRHDPCILPRVVPVIESVVYLVLLDYLN